MTLTAIEVSNLLKLLLGLAVSNLIVGLVGGEELGVLKKTLGGHFGLLGTSALLWDPKGAVGLCPCSVLSYQEAGGRCPFSRYSHVIVHVIPSTNLSLGPLETH